MMVEWILINTCNLSNTEGGFPPYGYSGYSAPSYGYGLANNGMGYGGYGGKGYGKWVCSVSMTDICIGSGFMVWV
uniref:Uncharacterized protein n=1 Tax=Vitis vinifera TaxID=29760 RepID=F6H0T7_VITVI